jgi:hypothetical protein
VPARSLAVLFQGGWCGEENVLSVCVGFFVVFSVFFYTGKEMSAGEMSCNVLVPGHVSFGGLGCSEVIVLRRILSTIQTFFLFNAHTLPSMRTFQRLSPIN